MDRLCINPERDRRSRQRL